MTAAVAVAGRATTGVVRGTWRTGGTGVGVEIVSPGAAGTTAPATGTPASDRPSATGAPDPNYGLATPTAKDTALPPVEKAAPAPDRAAPSTPAHTERLTR